MGLQESSIKNPLKGFKSDQLIQSFADCVQKRSKTGHKLNMKEQIRGVGKEGVRGTRIGLISDLKNIKIDFMSYIPLFEKTEDVSISEGQHFGKSAQLIHISSGEKLI